MSRKRKEHSKGCYGRNANAIKWLFYCRMLEGVPGEPRYTNASASLQAHHQNVLHQIPLMQNILQETRMFSSLELVLCFQTVQALSPCMHHTASHGQVLSHRTSHSGFPWNGSFRQPLYNSNRIKLQSYPSLRRWYSAYNRAHAHVTLMHGTQGISVVLQSTGHHFYGSNRVTGTKGMNAPSRVTTPIHLLGTMSSESHERTQMMNRTLRCS